MRRTIFPALQCVRNSTANIGHPSAWFTAKTATAEKATENWATGNTADKKTQKTRGRKSVHFNVQHILGTVQDIMKRKPSFLLPNFPVAVLFRLPFSTVAFFQLPFLPLPFLPFTLGLVDHFPVASV